MNSNIGILGAGNIGQALVRGLCHQKHKDYSQRIFISNRSQKKLEKLKEAFQVKITSTNEEIFENCGLIFICVKPQDLKEVLEGVSSLVRRDQTLVSLAAGVPLAELKMLVPECEWMRLMPNTPMSVGRGLMGLQFDESTPYRRTEVIDLLESLGKVIVVDDEDKMTALTIACASGTGFVYELMLYFQDWLTEYDFSSEEARTMALQTFLGAAALGEARVSKSLTEMIEQVASRKGTTSAGLESMRETDLERGLRIAFEKSFMRERQIAHQFKKPIQDR